MKKLKMVIFVLCLALLFGCSQNKATPSDSTIEKTVKLLDMPEAKEFMSSSGSDDQIKQAASADLEEYFRIPLIELFSKLGNKYEIVGTDDEIRIEGSYFDQLGLMFVFNPVESLDDSQASLGFIICDKSFRINGAGGGMNFEQIKDKLGKAKVKETWYGTPKKTVYEISYTIDGFNYRFFSFNKSGTDSNLIIQKAS